MARCDRPDCGRGDIDYQGFCAVCARRPLPAPARAADRVAPAAPAPAPPPAAAQARPEPWWGQGLVDAESVPEIADEPAETVDTVPEEQRYCPGCRRAVGRRRDEAPGRVTGFCPNCGHQFDFTRSRAGQVIADRYEVKRMIGAGSFGAAYLAHDRNLGTEVVLKDLTQSVAKTARLERDALVELRHDSIVRIYGYEREGPYLVLEYVRGTQLSARAGSPLEVVLAHGLQILQALDYLHARGLLHIDVKPSNIIRFGEQGADGRRRDRVRLIDFGAVWKLGSPGPVTTYTVAYAPPSSDPEHALPTVGFDLFCLGSTLLELCRPHLREPTAPGVAALDRLLKRATDTNTPERRFVSARQFAEQLSGVIRQVVAAPPARARISRPSTQFGSMTEPLHGGLGAPRPLSHWITGRLSANCRLTLTAPFTSPAPADVAAALPAPLADPDDPMMTGACGSQLAACRTALRRGDLTSADSAFEEIKTLSLLPEWSWILSWYGGLIALAHGDVHTATSRISAVQDALPGDLIPLLALGLCAEIDSRLAEARQLYETVVDTSPALSAAGFGLARTHLLTGQRDDAVHTAERLAQELHARDLRFERGARIAEVRLLAAVNDSCIPDEANLSKASELADGLEVGIDAQLLLRAEIQYGRSRVTGDWLALSELLPDLAKLAETRPDFFAMVDLANNLRSPIERWWQRRRRRIRDRSAVG